MINLAEQLRSWSHAQTNNPELLRKGADEIARLTTELDEAKAIGNNLIIETMVKGTEIERLRVLSQNNAASWDALVRERDALREEIERLHGIGDFANG